MNYLNCKRWKW